MVDDKKDEVKKETPKEIKIQPLTLEERYQKIEEKLIEKEKLFNDRMKRFDAFVTRTELGGRSAAGGTVDMTAEEKKKKKIDDLAKQVGEVVGYKL